MLVEADFDTWSNIRKHYLPTEYHSLFEVIDKHTEQFHKLPSIEELKLAIRDSSTLDKVYALESIDTEVEAHILLEYVKNDYAQKEVLYELDKWVDSSIAFETAEEVVRHIQQIGINLEAKVELVKDTETMQKLSLFDSEEEMQSRITLGFNHDFDSRFNFRPSDLILLGGRRGAGKSLTGSNISRHILDTMNKKVVYFSIEMESREVLQRDASIATQIAHSKIRNRNLSVEEWHKLAKWWSTRYEDGEAAYEAYLTHNDFNKFHKAISRHPLIPAHLDIVYNPNLTLGQIHAEIDKRVNQGDDIGLIVVDYVQKVKRLAGGSGLNSFDWQEQIYVANALKTLASERRIPVYSPYQIDATGEARFAKGILDPADAAFTLKAHKGDTPCMEFATVKMRGADDEEVFCSAVNWMTLKIGPDSVDRPEEPSKKSSKTSFSVKDLGKATAGIYDN